jgi:hypothetical protein
VERLGRKQAVMKGHIDNDVAGRAFYRHRGSIFGFSNGYT